MDILIKDIPEGCENDAKEGALSAIERFISKRDLALDMDKVKTAKALIDTIRVSNSLTAKYSSEKAIQPAYPNG
jgi:hypothetical protein